MDSELETIQNQLNIVNTELQNLEDFFILNGRNKFNLILNPTFFAEREHNSRVLLYDFYLRKQKTLWKKKNTCLKNNSQDSPESQEQR